MRRFTLLLPALLLALAAPAAEPAAEPDTNPALDKIIQSLIRDLGSERYDLRERATQALRRIGIPAIKWLEKAAQDDDPEVRTRAKDILRDVRLGIQPDWPADIILTVRHYGRFSEQERYAKLQKIADAIGPKAVPFLVTRLAEGTDREAKYAFQVLQSKLSNADTWRQLKALIKDPTNGHQARALAWALAQSGQAVEALELLANAQIKDATRNKAIEAGVTGLLAKLGERQFPHVAKVAARFAQAAPNDARFLYLQAEALAALHQDPEARALRDKAIKLQPDAEAPHYVAGELLGKLGRRRLAAREWQKILDVPPADGVYDINALLRLSSIHAASGIYERAAAHLQKALDGYLEAKAAGTGFGIIGGSLDTLQAEIERLRKKAVQFPAKPDAAIRDRLAENAIHLHVGVRVKDGTLDDLRRALAPVASQLTIDVKPPDLRIFDQAGATLRYDPDKKQLLILLAGKPAARPLPFTAKEDPTHVAIHAADCTHVFKINPETGDAETIARFEKDYTLTLRPGIKIAALADIKLTLNGKAHDWETLLKGIPLDRLPPQFALVLEGTTPAGKRITTRLNVKPVEPKITPLK